MATFGDGRRTRLAAGTAVFVSLALAVVLIFKSFSGDFGDNVRVTADISQIGDSLDHGDIVTYRDVIVGEVSSFSGDGTGGAALKLRIKGNLARQVPANVTAIAVPASLFGNTEIMLLPPHSSWTRTLRTGDRIPADASAAASGLQTALADAYDLLIAVHPADLDAALTSFATALRGQGDRIGKLIDEAAAYLKAIAPTVPRFTATLRSLATVTTQLAKVSPSLLASVADLITPAKAIVDAKRSVQALLAVAPRAVDDARAFFGATSQSVITIITNEEPFLKAMADNPNALPNTLVGLKTVTDAFRSAFHDGKLQVEAVITGINSAGLGPVLLGQPSEILQALSDPAPYTDADCPRYPGANGPNCPTAKAAVVSTGNGEGGSVASVGSTSEVTTVQALISTITGQPQDQVPTALDLLIGPLLRNSATVIR